MDAVVHENPVYENDEAALSTTLQATHTSFGVEPIYDSVNEEPVLTTDSHEYMTLQRVPPNTALYEPIITQRSFLTLPSGAE